MPLTAATTDRFTKVGVPGTATTLSAPGYTAGVSTSINVGSTTNWSTDTLIFFAIDRAEIVNGEEVRIAGTYCEFSGIVSSATAVGDLTKEYGSAQDYAAGSLTRVYIPVSSSRENAMVDGLNNDHTGRGYHKTLNDTHGNEMIEFGVTASAINQHKVTNAAIGNKPKLSASGGDTNIGLDYQTKGSGIHQLLDGNGNEVLKTAAGTASAINELEVTNAAIGTAPQLAATGGDTNIDLKITPKGTGRVKKGSNNIDAWEELGRTTLSGAGDTISVTGLGARKHLKIVADLIDTGGTINAVMTFNNDTAANYALTRSNANGADTAATAQSNLSLSATTAAQDVYAVGYVSNKAAQEKIGQMETTERNTAGAANAPTRRETVIKWANTADQITRVDVVNSGTGDYAIGSEVIVYGSN